MTKLLVKPDPLAGHRAFCERISRTWTASDERFALKLLMAFHRFREAGLTERAAVSMVRAWESARDGASGSGRDHDKHPMHEKIVQRYQAARAKRDES